MNLALVLVPVGILAMIAVFFVGSGLAGKCPACGTWWGMKEIQRSEIGREPGVKWVKRTEVQRDPQNKETRVERQVQINVMRITYDCLLSCTTCQHELRKEVAEEKEAW